MKTPKSDPRSPGRRNVLRSLGLGAGAAGLVGIPVARAALLPEGRTAEPADVAVIGAGISGLAAALQAAAEGASVVVLDKTEAARSGGNSRIAGGLFSVPKDDSAQARAAYLQDFIEKCRGRGNETIMRLMATHGRDDIAWLTQHGVEFRPEGALPPYRVATFTAAPGIYMGMPDLLDALTGGITDAGGRVVYQTKARQLLMDSRGAVAGVRALDEEGVVDFPARAVVIATGGYAGNSRILTDFVDPGAEAMRVRGVKWATGDGLLLAQEAGAGIRNMGGLTSLHIAAVDPTETAAGNPWAGLPYGIAVNREGERYVDESKGYVAHGKAALQQPGQTAALLFDAEIARLDGPASSLSTFRNLGLKVHEADTIAELAGLIDAPAEALEATVESFNAAVADGAAPGATPPKAKFAYKLDTPPFMGFAPLVPGVTLSFGGVMINERAEVLEPDGRVIPGLYAAGEGAGGVFYDDYIGGGSLANCLVMGRIAGRESAARRA